MSYAAFGREKGFEERVSVLTSYALTPDPKPIALWGMGNEVVTGSEIWQRFLEISELPADDAPLSESALYRYFYGSPGRGYDGSLVSSGLVERTILTKSRGDVAGYALTDVGFDFAIPLAARATYFVNSLPDEAHGRKSMWRVLGSSAGLEGKTRGYTVYRIAKALLEYKDGIPFPLLCEETGIDRETARNALSCMAEADLAVVEPINGHENMARPTMLTPIFWDLLLSPVEALSETLSTRNCPFLEMHLRTYDENPDLRAKHIQKQLGAYSNERTPRNTAREQVLDAMPDADVKLSDLIELIRAEGSFVSLGGVEEVLASLIDSGKVERTKHGRYRKIA